MPLFRFIFVSFTLSLTPSTAGFVCDLCQGAGTPTQSTEVIEDQGLGRHTCEFFYRSGLEEGYSEEQCANLTSAALVVCGCGENDVESPYDVETGICFVCLEGRKPRKLDVNIPVMGMTCGELYFLALNGEFSHQKDHCLVAAAHAAETCDCHQDVLYNRRTLDDSTEATPETLKNLRLLRH